MDGDGGWCGSSWTEHHIVLLKRIFFQFSPSLVGWCGAVDLMFSKSFMHSLFLSEPYNIHCWDGFA
jgi:hypothetical protein